MGEIVDGGVAAAAALTALGVMLCVIWGLRHWNDGEAAAPARGRRP